MMVFVTVWTESGGPLESAPEGLGGLESGQAQDVVKLGGSIDRQCGRKVLLSPLKS
jgi:hypothetical protein